MDQNTAPKLLSVKTEDDNGNKFIETTFLIDDVTIRRTFTATQLFFIIEDHLRNNPVTDAKTGKVYSGYYVDGL